MGTPCLTFIGRGLEGFHDEIFSIISYYRRSISIAHP